MAHHAFQSAEFASELRRLPPRLGQKDLPLLRLLSVAVRHLALHCHCIRQI